MGTGTLYSETVQCICQPSACQGEFFIVCWFWHVNPLWKVKVFKRRGGNSYQYIANMFINYCLPTDCKMQLLHIKWETERVKVTAWICLDTADNISYGHCSVRRKPVLCFYKTKHSCSLDCPSRKTHIQWQKAGFPNDHHTQNVDCNQ